MYIYFLHLESNQSCGCHKPVCYQLHHGRFCVLVLIPGATPVSNLDSRTWKARMLPLHHSEKGLPGIEPGTYRSAIECSTNWAITPKTSPRGFEPLTHRLTISLLLYRWATKTECFRFKDLQFFAWLIYSLKFFCTTHYSFLCYITNPRRTC